MKKIFLAILLLSLLGCKEREFGVSPVPKPKAEIEDSQVIKIYKRETRFIVMHCVGGYVLTEYMTAQHRMMFQMFSENNGVSVPMRCDQLD